MTAAVSAPVRPTAFPWDRDTWPVDGYKVGDKVWMHELEWCPAVVIGLNPDAFEAKTSGPGVSLRALVRTATQVFVTQRATRARYVWPGRTDWVAAVDDPAGLCQHCRCELYSDARAVDGGWCCPASWPPAAHVVDPTTGPHTLRRPDAVTTQGAGW
jgi:hypothetical protein